jgi:hypothetical protein
MQIVWQYAGTAHAPLDSAMRASQQRLVNGNTLIAGSSGGRILEVTCQGAGRPPAQRPEAYRPATGSG